MTPKQIKDIIGREYRRLKSWRRVGEFFGFKSDSAAKRLHDTGKANAPTLRLLALLKLYGRYASRLWDARYVKAVKRILKGEPDENDK